MDEERVVLLGTIQERQGVDNGSPYVCKAGGTPVYAPVDSDRTLYVFGCNAVTCTESPGSWRVLRDQVEKVKEAPPALDAVEELVTKVDNVKLAWGSDSDDSDWSDDEGAGSSQAQGADLIDLEALLQQRDDAMKAPATASKSTSNSSAPKRKDPLKEAGQHKEDGSAFPALSIEVIDEPFEDYTSEHDFAHENTLLEQYMKQEEEEKSAEVGDLRSVITNAKKKGGAVASGSSAAATGESYEKTPAQQRHFMRFQKRISRCPLQCLRYDYGGEPLWPVVVPQNLVIPRCAGCGEERAFEMQLTPTINYFLKVDEFAAQQKSDSAGDNVSASSEAMLPSKTAVASGGMDWLSLIVYSCSQSCAQSHEEFIYVLPSPTV
ncbi:hypothetical protein BBJ28_00007648 [Nothophytophthora sp. Chile5]|nr:hypothetical protein BBJ28_00007648 [Nothophytophthora sp. Chile5]